MQKGYFPSIIVYDIKVTVINCCISTICTVSLVCDFNGSDLGLLQFQFVAGLFEDAGVTGPAAQAVGRPPRTGVVRAAKEAPKRSKKQHRMTVGSQVLVVASQLTGNIGQAQFIA